MIKIRKQSRLHWNDTIIPVHGLCQELDVKVVWYHKITADNNIIFAVGIKNIGMETQSSKKARIQRELYPVV